MTPKQKRVYETIRRLLAEKGISPSYREIAYASGYRSTGIVSRHIAMLRRDGYLTATPRASRSLRIIEPALSLKPANEEAIGRYCQERGISRGDFLNLAVEEYLAGYPALFKAAANSSG